MRFHPHRDLDRLLRGDRASPPAPDHGPGMLNTLLLTVALGGIAGAAIGLHGTIRPGSHEDASSVLQVVSSAIKVPALFILTILITLPSFYVFNALLGPRLAPGTLARTSLRGVTIMVAVLASLAPIVMFFQLGTSSYAFIKVLVAAAGVVSGILGVRWLWTALDEAVPAEHPIPEEIETPKEIETPEEIETRQPPRPDSRATRSSRPGGRWLIGIWILLFALVGSQMAWLLRPFIGNPDAPFEWLRPSGGTLLQDLVRTVTGLIGG